MHVVKKCDGTMTTHTTYHKDGTKESSLPTASLVVSFLNEEPLTPLKFYSVGDVIPKLRLEKIVTDPTWGRYHLNWVAHDSEVLDVLAYDGDVIYKIFSANVVSETQSLEYWGPSDPAADFANLLEEMKEKDPDAN